MQNIWKHREVSNSKILTWINNFTSQSIGVQLAKYDTTKEVRDLFKCFYNQSNILNSTN